MILERLINLILLCIILDAMHSWIANIFVRRGISPFWIACSATPETLMVHCKKTTCEKCILWHCPKYKNKAKQRKDDNK